MIALVALDIAGTTVAEGGAVYRVLGEVVAEHGTPATDADIRQWMGADKRAALVGLTGDPDAAEVLHDRFVARLRETYAAHPPAPVPGVLETFARLRAAGVQVALTTGFDRLVADPLLAALDWQVGRDLDAVVCAPEVAAGRPAPHMIARAMELTGVTDPAHVLTAGDTVLDVRAGLASGASIVVAVLSGAHERADLELEHPTHVLDDVTAIPDLIGV